MLATFSFKCSSGHYTDAFVKRGTETRPCDTCDEVATKCIRHAPKLDWLGMAQGEAAGPEFVDRWDKMHKDRKAHEERAETEHGDYGPMAGS